MLLAVNKAKACRAERVTAEFHELGLGAPLPISVRARRERPRLVELALAACPPQAPAEPEAAVDPKRSTHQGRDRRAAPTSASRRWSTRCSARSASSRSTSRARRATRSTSTSSATAAHYTLIDTAGVRRRGKVIEAVEKFSVIKTLQAIEDANVVVLLLDAQQEITEQDAHLAGFILEAGRALVVAINKWDGLERDARGQRQARHRPQARIPRLRAQHTISAREGKGIGRCSCRSIERLRGGDGEAADAEAHAGAHGRRGRAQQPPRAG